jgi:hypothetical protein
MLLRREGEDVLAIGQASHAWISGQFAREWGNDLFLAPDPYEDVCLAAAQHDVGMARWDLEPTLNPQTGLPHSFLEMPITTHLELWSEAPRRLLTQSRYAALLVSMHGWRLYERRDPALLPPADGTAVRAYLKAQQELQTQLLSSLRSDAIAARHAEPELVQRNSQLLWGWDYLSLAVCLDWAPDRMRSVPTVDGPGDVQLVPGAQPRHVTLSPWPFRTGAMSVRCEARRLTGTFSTPAALHEGLSRARWETVAFELRPR